MGINHQPVRIWEEELTIPTYKVGEPSSIPMFLERRVFQGSSGDVYPLPVIESVSDVPTDQNYHVVFLENEYLKIMVMPELGGRIQMALDKTNGYHFVYYNSVIKPALVGLAGPWIAGGIEFNWPQHHRPTTFLPVQFSIEMRSDGSGTVWVGEIERQNHTQGLAGLTLYPDRAYLEIRGSVINRTPLPQPFLWWANPAVHVDESYQSVFPPDVTAVMDHGKRDVSSFPIARGTYYKVDYSAGVDISRYANIPVPTSYMAYHSSYDFVGGYNHNRQAGMLHVADHHISPGKKQWTWGTGDFGRAWERHLTDEDGPYIELMTGMFTDNQPDFTWLAPYEQKSFVQVFLPYKRIGYVRQANEDILISLDFDDSADKRIARIGVYATSDAERQVMLIQDGRKLYGVSVRIGPDHPFNASVSLADTVGEEPICIDVANREGDRILSYTPDSQTVTKLPEPARDPGRPEEIASLEQLYLVGLHLEQYKHATQRPEDYYREGLRRDPGDARCNNAYGRLLLKRGLFSESEVYFRNAITRLTQLNPNPADGEPHFNLGLSLKYQDRFTEAYDAFFKSTWSGPWQSAGYLEVARIDCMQGNFAKAQLHIESAIGASARNGVALHLKAVIFRALGKRSEARLVAEENLKLNSLDFASSYEAAIEDSTGLPSVDWNRVLHSSPQPYIDIALDYADAGFYEDACVILDAAISCQRRAAGVEKSVYPMLLYYRGYYVHLAARANGTDAAADAIRHYEEAERITPGICFPDRVQSIRVLQSAAAALPSGECGHTQYYLGNLWYSKRQYDRAVACWRRSVGCKRPIAAAYRNIAIAEFNKSNDADAALQAMRMATDLEPMNARIRFELDLLLKRIGTDPMARLAELWAVHELCDLRDDLYLEFINLHNCVGRYTEALSLLSDHSFHPWEGGEGKVSFQYIFAHQQLAREAMRNHDAAAAIEHLRSALQFPENLGEGRLPGTRNNDTHYLLGNALTAIGETDSAFVEYDYAAQGNPELGLEMFYNDQPADMLYYMGCANRELGNDVAAQSCFERLYSHGTEHRDDRVNVDFFAVSLPDFSVLEEDLVRRNRAQCDYLAGLGALGLGDRERSRSLFAEALRAIPDLLRARAHFGVDNDKG